MIKPKYRKRLDSAQLAHAAVERAIGSKLKPPKPSQPQGTKAQPKKRPKGA